MINSLEICHIQPWSFFLEKMFSCWNSSFQSWFLIGFCTVSSCHICFFSPTWPSLDHRVWHLRLDHPNVVKFFESSRRPNRWGGWRQRKHLKHWGWNMEFLSCFFFFWPSEAMWIFRESINFFNPVPTASLSHLGSMGFTKSRSISCICSFFCWGGGLAFSRISTFLLVLTRDLLMDGYENRFPWDGWHINKLRTSE